MSAVSKLFNRTSQSSILWGVATSGYQSEGGYNGAGQPQNNWSQAEDDGSVMTTRQAADFWSRYDDDFETCQQLGLTAFRLGLEWARIQPTTVNQASSPPMFDTIALDAYADRLASCISHGLDPIVTLHHFTHPAWLGVDAWLSEDTLDLFINYVRVTLTHINLRLTEHYSLQPLQWLITINEPNILVLNTYFNQQFPSAVMPGASPMMRAYDLLLAAHVRAYSCIRHLYDQQGWPTPQISLNTYCSDLYWSDKIIWDLLFSRKHEIKASDWQNYSFERAKALDLALVEAQLPLRKTLPYQVGRLARWCVNQFSRQLVDSGSLSTFFKEIAASDYSIVTDFIGLDYYDPFFAHTIRIPTFSDFEFQTQGLRAWLMSGITSKWWDWRSLPEGLHFFCKYYSSEFGQCPILIAENGMALRRKPDNSIASQRSDQLLRSQFLKAHVGQVIQLVQEGIPLIGYMHWSLTDNYEWGSFTPRFGLFSIDYQSGLDRLHRDHLGDNPSETYAQLVREAEQVIPAESRTII